MSNVTHCASLMTHYFERSGCSFPVMSGLILSSWVDGRSCGKAGNAGGGWRRFPLFRSSEELVRVFVDMADGEAVKMNGAEGIGGRLDAEDMTFER